MLTRWVGRGGLVVLTVAITAAVWAGPALAGQPNGSDGTGGSAPLVTNDPNGPIVGAPGQTPPMSSEMLSEDAVKLQQAIAYYQAAGAGPTSPQSCYPDCPLKTYNLAATQQTQQKSYWCGPATVSESLAQIAGATQLTQAQAAQELGTTTSGTDWSNSTGYPVVNVMNANTPSAIHYVAFPVGSVTSTAISNYEATLVDDVYQSHQPVIGDQWLVSTSQYTLAGEPKPLPGSNTFHWFNIRGYSTVSTLGDQTNYEDSWWTAYGSTSATAIVTMVSGRGYVG